jgi:glycosyltransferase involved in cell wall biosynthesis
MNTTKVLFITDTYWPASGGAEEAVRQCAALLPDDFTRRVLTTAVPVDRPTLYGRAALLPRARDYADPAGVAVTTIRAGLRESVLLLPLLLWNTPGMRRRGAPGLYDRLFRFYRAAFSAKIKTHAAAADIVHCFSTGHLARCAAEVCSRGKIPIVQNPFIHFGRWGDSPGQLQAYARADAVISPTAHFKRRFCDASGADEKRVFIVPPVIPDPPCSAAPAQQRPGDPAVLFLGRREPHKGLPLLVAAFNALSCPGRLVIGGPGAALPSAGRISDAGAVDEATKLRLLYECDCLCVPSEDETFGIAFAEAMSLGKPVVALNVPPTTEIVEHGVTGLLVPPRDAPALTGALERLLIDADMRRKMGAAAKQRFEALFSGRKSIEKIVEIYSGITRKK